MNDASRRDAGLVALLALVLCIAGSLLVEPVPAVHDEFSHLLAADTFSHGRWSNPSHPFWEHFESIHIIHQPVYASKYLPGQGLLLALGQWLTGRAIVGAWLAVAAACAAITWMLQGWMPRRWALLGGLLTATHPYVVGDWGHGYWGGALAASGGALLYGALPRLGAGRRLPGALACGSGLVMLAFSRPLEGLLIAIPAFAWLAWPRARPGRRPTPRQGVAIAALCMAGAGVMLHYNNSLTGNPLRLPYQVYAEQVATPPVLVWQQERVPVRDRHERIAVFWRDWARRAYLEAQTPAGFAKTLGLKAQHLASHYLASPIVVLALLAPLALWRRRRKFALFGVAALLLLVGLAQISWIYIAHYMAPGLGIFVGLLLLAARQLRCWRRHATLSGRALLNLLLLGHVLASAAAWPGFLAKPEWALERARIEQRLLEQGGRHLIMVDSGRPVAYDLHAEWVYNAAQIDAAPIVWARSMGQAKNQRLSAYFRDRSLWRLPLGTPPLRLVPIR